MQLSSYYRVASGFRGFSETSRTVLDIIIYIYLKIEYAYTPT